MTDEQRLQEVRDRHEHDGRVWTNHGQPHKDRAYLLSVVDELRDMHVRGRWNIETTDYGLMICRGEHDRSEDCEWEHLYWADNYLQLQSRIEELELYAKAAEGELSMQVDRIAELEKESDRIKREQPRRVKEAELRAQEKLKLVEAAVIDHCTDIRGAAKAIEDWQDPNVGPFDRTIAEIRKSADELEAIVSGKNPSPQKP